MKYLITGITGFAGPHLANLLIENGHEVYGLIRNSNGRETDILDVVPERNFSKITFLYSDLTNFRTLNQIFKTYRFDGVFHLAAQSHPPTSFIDPIGTWEDNVTGSMNLIQAIQDNQGLDCKVLFCSTSEVYGNTGVDKHKIKTTDVILPANPYGASKAAIDLYLQERFISKQIRGVITRAFSHTGPRRGKTFSISSDAYQIAKIMKGMQSKELFVGNLRSVRVVLDVRDIVNAYYLLMLSPDANNKIFNVSGDDPHEMSVYTDLLLECGNVTDVVKTILPSLYRPIDIHYQHGDCSDLVNTTNWKPKYALKQTMSDLLEYWLNKLEP